MFDVRVEVDGLIKFPLVSWQFSTFEWKCYTRGLMQDYGILVVQLRDQVPRYAELNAAGYRTTCLVRERRCQSSVGTHQQSCEEERIGSQTYAWKPKPVHESNLGSNFADVYERTVEIVYWFPPYVLFSCDFVHWFPPYLLLRALVSS
eukprot:g22104.t1